MKDELFSEDNYIATIVWDRNRKNDAKFFSVGHEYMLVYSKNKRYLVDNDFILREKKEGLDIAVNFYKKLKFKFDSDYAAIQKEWRLYFNSLEKDNPLKPLGRFSKVDDKGPYRDDGNISWPGGNGPKYEVVHPLTNKPCKVPDGGWRYSNPKRFFEEVESGRVVFGEDETTLPRQCRYLFESGGQVMPSVHFSYAQTATMNFIRLMGNRIFDNPKSWQDIERLINYHCHRDSIIIDFFAGSATTAHSVMDLNAKDNSNRKYIMVQLPEPCIEKSEAYKAGYKTIADIGKERIRRAGEKILSDNQDKEGIENLDFGFKVFKLDSSNIKAWDVDEGNIQQSLLDAIDNIKPERSQEDVLYEVLLKYGLDLTLPIEERSIVGKTVYSIGFGALVVCLDDDITLDVIEGIGQLKEELEPEVMKVVFLDNGFADPVVKTNALQILKRYSIDDVKSI